MGRLAYEPKDLADMFEKSRTFEEVIRAPGKDAEAPLRPFTRLRENVKLNAFMGASLEEIHERNTKALATRQREDDVRKAAGEQGIPVGRVRMGTADISKVAEVVKSYQNATDPGHEERKEAHAASVVLADRAKEEAQVKRKDEAKSEFDQTLAPAGSLEELIMNLFTYIGEQGGRGAGALSGLHLSQRVDANPTATTVLTTMGTHAGGTMGKRVAKRAGEAVIRAAKAAPARNLKPIQGEDERITGISGGGEL